jgi:hypothetical protein
MRRIYVKDCKVSSRETAEPDPLTKIAFDVTVAVDKMLELGRHKSADATTASTISVRHVVISDRCLTGEEGRIAPNLMA